MKSLSGSVFKPRDIILGILPCRHLVRGEAVMAAPQPERFVRTLVFSLASNAAVLSVMQFGLTLWPERLPVNTQNVFWLASRVNTVGLAGLALPRRK